MQFNFASLALFSASLLFCCKDVLGMECYKISCWGNHCTSEFHMEKEKYAEKCGEGAEGCYHIKGTGLQPDNGLPIVRETRECWTPKRSGGGGKSLGLGECQQINFTAQLPPKGNVILTGHECICPGDLCNGEEEPKGAASIMSQHRQCFLFLFSALVFLFSKF